MNTGLSFLHTRSFVVWFLAQEAVFTHKSLTTFHICQGHNDMTCHSVDNGEIGKYISINRQQDIKILRLNLSKLANFQSCIAYDVLKCYKNISKLIILSPGYWWKY